MNENLASCPREGKFYLYLTIGARMNSAVHKQTALRYAKQTQAESNFILLFTRNRENKHITLQKCLRDKRTGRQEPDMQLRWLHVT